MKADVLTHYVSESISFKSVYVLFHNSYVKLIL